MCKKYLNWFRANKNKPIGKMIIIILIATILTLAINLIKGNSLIKNMDFVLYLSVMYLFAWLILKYIKTSLLQFLVSFIASLTVLTLQMFSDGSYADYTSFIVVGGVALFLAFMMLIVIKALSKSSK